jgi:hypothetical protein
VAGKNLWAHVYIHRPTILKLNGRFAPNKENIRACRIFGDRKGSPRMTEGSDAIADHMVWCLDVVRFSVNA